MMRWLPVLLCLIAACSEPPSALPQTDDLNRPVPVTMTVSPVDGAELVRVPAATFVMGADDGLFAEAPAHRVRLPAFYIDRLEVTNARFARFVQASGRRPQGPWRRGFMPKGKRKERPLVTVPLSTRQIWGILLNCLSLLPLPHPRKKEHTHVN